MASSLQFQRRFVILEFFGAVIDFFSQLNGKMLIGAQGRAELCIHNSSNGHRLTTIKIAVELSEATWTPLGNIAYLANEKVFVMSAKEVAISSKAMIQLRHIITSYDGYFYLADFEAGVYQSTKNERSWIHVFQISNEWGPIIAFKINDVKKDYYWFLDWPRKLSSNKYFALHINDKSETTNEYLMQQSIGLPKSCRRHAVSNLLYDGEDNVFMFNNSDKNFVLIFR